MSDNQKYYYMRLKQDFFETEEMIILESMQDGYLYSNILLKLYLRSLKRDGKLMFNDTIPYSAEVLATVTRHSVGTIEKAMDVFQKLGLVEVMDDGAIYMLQIQEYIGKSSTEAERKKRYRDRIKLEKREKNEALENLGHLSTKEVGHLSGHSSTRDRDRDKIDIKTEVEERNGQMSSATAADKSNLNIFEYYQERVGLLDGFQLQKLEEYQVIDGLEPELIKIAIDKAADNSKRSFGYVNSILKSWSQSGIKTVAQQIEEQNNFTSNKPNSDKPKFGPACSKY
ncbi:DnaD-like helicase loader [Streptococcus phage CHPC930]|uniref:Replication initiation n=1 Tax=Streptococcus phage CHPC930 TaxID=2365051 RepID=A0A3G8FF34_9CAUD|nr:DnaD-like helicase loader [Streptococcus phage CHPC930]AZF92410.1 replication initiation [Streptococcus phage CHPC930]